MCARYFSSAGVRDRGALGGRGFYGVVALHVAGDDLSPMLGR